jgi:hypothetical protein
MSHKQFAINIKNEKNSKIHPKQPNNNLPSNFAIDKISPISAET